MVFLYINQKNYNKGDKNLVEKLDELMGKKNNKIFYQHPHPPPLPPPKKKNHLSVHS